MSGTQSPSGRICLMIESSNSMMSLRAAKVCTRRWPTSLSLNLTLSTGIGNSTKSPLPSRCARSIIWSGIMNWSDLTIAKTTKRKPGYMLAMIEGACRIAWSVAVNRTEGDPSGTIVSGGTPQSIVTFLSRNSLPAPSNFEHFPKMPSAEVVSKHSPFPARAMPRHVAVDTVDPIPRVKTRRGASGGARATASATIRID